jgi:predicted porin
MQRLAVIIALLGTAPLLAATAGPLRADGIYSCCADLEGRIEDLEATTARKGNRAVSLKVSGYLNEAMVQWDDGFERNIYFVTNETERSRIALNVEVEIAPKWKAGALLELGFHIDPENKLDQNVAHDMLSRLPDTRYAYWYLENEDLGEIDIGLTRMATYHVVMMMNTQTWYYARFGIGTWIGQDGNGYFLRKQDGALLDGPNALRWGDINVHAPAAAPGEGSRLDAVKYQSPEIAGFTASAAYASLGAADVALRYDGNIGDFDLTAGIGYGNYMTFDSRRCAVLGGGDVNCQNFGLSGTVMHKPTGLYLSGSYGAQWDLNAPALFGAPVEDLSEAYYVQAGIERKFFELGKTTIFGEYERDNVGAGVDAGSGGVLDTTALGPDPLPPGDTSYDRMAASVINTWGLGISQTFADDAVLLYISGRLFSADVYTSATGLKAGAIKTDLEDFLAIVGGAKVTF